jgi:hypothetical protein
METALRLRVAYPHAVIGYIDTESKVRPRLFTICRLPAAAVAVDAKSA